MTFEKEKIDYRKVDVIIHKIKSIWKMEKKKKMSSISIVK